MSVGILIHAPREGSDQDRRKPWRLCRFLPTLPARGATPLRVGAGDDLIFLPTLPARGATARPGKPGRAMPISTHAPRKGSDPDIPPAQQMYPGISTHAPRKGSDGVRDMVSAGGTYFYPRSP